MYSVDNYGRMITDELRTGAYVRAMEKAIKPGSVVLDIGTGPGLFALVACKLGARQVYAVEPDSVIQLAIECARQNGLSERIEFIQDFSTKITLPEPVDLIVADLRGVLPLFRTNLQSLKDAHDRFLAPQGVMIPAREKLYAALVHAPLKYQQIEAPWTTLYDVSLAPIRRVVMNTWRKGRVEIEDLLSVPVNWHTIDYARLNSFDIDSTITLDVTKTGTAHGFAIWFVSELYDDISFSTAPDQPELIYGNALLPLLHPIEVASGDKINLRLRADLVNDDYILTWETSTAKGNDSEASKVYFKQSDFQGLPISAKDLKRRSSNFTPVLSDEAAITSFILLRMNGNTTNQQLAKILKTEFPERFMSDTEALDAVAAVSAKYSK